MTKITDLKGFCYPLTPEGRASIVGSFPWSYGTEYTVISYRGNAAAIARWLPAPLEPGPEPDRCYVAFSKWWSVWDGGEDMPAINPGRTQYREAAIWVGCSFEGRPGQMCLPIWVDNDFTMARGWFMGFPKKLGEIMISEYQPLNPRMPPVGIGTRITGICSAHGERLLKGSITLERQVQRSELPPPIGRTPLHIRHFPSIVKGAGPSVLELVSLGSESWKWDPVIWAGKGELEFFPSDLEDHMSLAPVEVLGGYRYRNGYTFDGGEVLHDWTREPEVQGRAGGNSHTS
jgi:acetoacetate decarboxylase